jgi:hypothetical protein
VLAFVVLLVVGVYTLDVYAEKHLCVFAAKTSPKCLAQGSAVILRSALKRTSVFVRVGVRLQKFIFAVEHPDKIVQTDI